MFKNLSILLLSEYESELYDTSIESLQNIGNEAELMRILTNEKESDDDPANRRPNLVSFILDFRQKLRNT